MYKRQLRNITRRLWQLATEQEPPLTGLWLALEAQPNPDFESGTHNGSISIPLKWHSIADIADGRRRVLDFIKYNQLGEMCIRDSCSTRTTPEATPLIRSRGCSSRWIMSFESYYCVLPKFHFL